MTDAQPRTDQEQRQHVYERVLRCVDAQTSPKQPPGCVPKQVHCHLVEHGNLDYEPVRRAVQAARENGDLVRWRDADGTPRLTVADGDKLQRAVDWLVDEIDKWSPEDKAQLGTLNAALQECESDV